MNIIMIWGVDSTQDTDSRGDSGEGSSASRDSDGGGSIIIICNDSAMSREGVGGMAVWYSTARGCMSSGAV